VREDVVVVDGLPEKIGPWAVLEFLAQGGNGVVYKGVRPGDTAALKVLKARSEEPKERFTREIGFLREHQDLPGVLPLLDAYLPEVPSRADRAWLAMPLAIPIEQVLEGRPLQDAVGARSADT
jgi:serine/threonine protein kinase